MTIKQGRFRKIGEGRRGVFLVAAVFLLTALVSALVLYGRDRYSFLYFGDAASHIVKARQFVDGNTPASARLGTVWLPLPHLLMVPAVAIDALFYGGIAGAVTGIPMYAGTCVLLFLIVRRLTGSAGLGFLGASLFGFNPNVVYIALTPMNEPALFFFLTLGGYALLRWIDGGNGRWFTAASVSVMLATLCRYEAWVIPPFLGYAALKYGPDHAAGETSESVRSRPGESGERTRRATLPPAAAALVSFLGILLWLGWNFIRYGDPLTFVRWTYGVAPQAVHDAPGREWYRALWTYLTALFFVFGPVVLLVSAGILRKEAGAAPGSPAPHGVAGARGNAAARRTVILLVYFALPALFTIASIAADFVQIDAWRWNWRLVLPAGMFFAVAASMGLPGVMTLVRSEGARAAVVVLLLFMPVVQLEFPAVGVAVYDDAHRVFSADPQGGAHAGEFLGREYTGGDIALITGYGQAERIMVSSGIPLRAFHTLRNPAEGDPVATITNGEQFLVIGMQKTAESTPYVERWLASMDTLLSTRRLRSDDGHYVILERKPETDAHERAAD